MRRSVWIRAVLLFVAGCAVVNGAMASVKCKGRRVSATYALTADKLDVGPKVPMGEVYSEVYRYRGELPGLDCIFEKESDFLSVYFRPSSSIASVVFMKYKTLYKTDVDGLGVSFIYERTQRDAYDGDILKIKDFADAYTDAPCKANTLCTLIEEPQLKIVLVKTGSVKSGKITDIPLVIMSAQSGTAGTAQDVLALTINSNISVISKTCLANPVEVNMGAYSTRVFTGIGSTAPSKDFSIELTNCPAFDGPGKKNLKFRIDPVLSALNASNGVLRLDASASTAGTGAASGVGIQIVTAQDSPLPLEMDQDSGLPLRNTEANYSIPLRARYLQTDSNVTPGPAKATANFTIIYP